MKTHSMVKRAGALVLAGGMLLGLAGPASADRRPTATATSGPGTSSPKAGTVMDALARACEGAVDRRLSTLGDLQGKVSASTYLTAGHRSTLLGEIGAEHDGLTALRAKVAADTDRATLVADCKSVVEHYRVYLLMIPKAHLTIAADASVTIAQKLTDLATRLQADVDAAKAAGKDVTKAQRDLDALKAAIGAGMAAVAPVPGLLGFSLPLDPSAFPADQHAVMTARSDMGTARTHFAEAGKDGRQVVADLKGLKEPKPATGTATG
jgi:hypothetical protein